jgi:CRISPR-associated exonuclease Cas4
MIDELLPQLLGGSAILLLIAAIALRSNSGLPWGRVRDDDAGVRHVPQRPLRSRRYGLVGRPDYVLERGRHLIPVELKPDREADQPYAADLAQLAAYLLLVEEQSGRPPPYGLLRYRHRTFRLRYTRRVRQELLTTLREMRDLLHHHDVARSHNERVRCLGCALRSVCGPQSLLR